MLTGYFIHSLMSILLYVDALYLLVCFWNGWYWLFLSMCSASFRSSCNLLIYWKSALNTRVGSGFHTQQSSSPRSSCKAGLVVMKSLSTCLFAKNFIFPSLVKLSLAGYEILGWKFFSLRILNIVHYSLLACRVSVERFVVSLMEFTLWVTRAFSLAAFNIFSFISTLMKLMVMWLGFVLLKVYLCGVICIFWIWMLPCLARLGKFSWIIS